MKNLWEELAAYSESDYYPFHMPGHKRFPTETIYKYDITEIEGFDNLHDAKGLLLSLQQKAARIYHADESFFLINGSTGGILSAVSAVAQDGKKLLMARNCHKSVYNAAAINRLQTEYLYPQVIADFDIQGEIKAKQVREHLAGRQDICGVVITSPTYDGVISDIREIAKAAHDCNIPLIVDEAHGAHFVLSAKAPESAVECGADLVINSIHKTLPALTQTALLHVQGELVSKEKLKNYLSIYQSSSPSYILMASIDGCMDFIAKEGAERYARLAVLRGRIDKAAAKFSRVRLLPCGERRDVGKLVISVKNTGMTGWELYRILLEKYHLQMEMAAPTYVLGILSVMDTEAGVGRLIGALAEVDEELSQTAGRNIEIGKEPFQTAGRNIEIGKEPFQTAGKNIEIGEEQPQTMGGRTEVGEELPQIAGKNAEIDKTLVQTAKKSARIKKEEKRDDMYYMEQPIAALGIYEAMQRKKKWVSPKEAVGKISGGFLFFYPPGIPFLVPGEVISEEVIRKIDESNGNEGCVTGISQDGKLCVL